MKKRLLTLLVIVAALTLGLATTVSAQNDNPSTCLNLSQEDCDILAAGVANTAANLTSLHALYTIDYTESNQVFVIGVNDAAVSVVGDISLATDAAMAATDPTKAVALSLVYGVKGNLGPYGVTGGQSIAYVDGVSYWTDAASGKWVGISTNDALMLGLGAASVGMTSMSGMTSAIPGMDMVTAMMDPSMLGENPAALLGGLVNPQALLTDPAGALGGLGMGMLPPLAYASAERLADMEMDGQTLNGFASTITLGPDLVAATLAANLGDMAMMIPAEVWDDIAVSLTVTRWYGADDQLQHGTQATLDVTIGSTARTLFVALAFPNAVSADTMLAPASFSLALDAQFDRINQAVGIAAPEGAAMYTLESIMGAMGAMTGGQ